MPLLVTADRVNPTRTGLYEFFEENRQGWQAFWEKMGGDNDKIVKWATDSGIESPLEWFTGLHSFLFEHYSGDYKLLQHSAAKNTSFAQFLSKLVGMHLKDPHEKWWYLDKGFTHRKYVSMLERAADISDEHSAVLYINGNSPQLGFRLHDEYLLSLTGYKEQMKQMAYALNKKADEIENEVYFKQFAPGDKVRHAGYTDKLYQVQGSVDNLLVLTDTNTDAVVCIEDVWNLEKEF